MGGQGSGRKPDPIKKYTQQFTPVGNFSEDQVFLPDYSGVAAHEKTKAAFASVTHNHNTSDIVSGSFDDARIAESNVTQHEAAIDHNNLTNSHNLTTDINHDNLAGYEANEHIDWTNATSNLFTTGDLIIANGSVLRLNTDAGFTRFLGSTSVTAGAGYSATGEDRSSNAGSCSVTYGGSSGSNGASQGNFEVLAYQGGSPPTSICEWDINGDFTNEYGAVFNDSGGDNDFRIEGNTEQNLFFVDASADKIGIGTSTPSKLLEVAGDLKADAVTIDKQIISAATAPSISAGAAAGTSPSLSITGTDIAGIINLTTGTSTTTGTLATITYANSFPNDSYVVLFPEDNDAAGVSNYIYATGTSSTFVLNTTTALTDSTAYNWNFIVVGK